MSSQPCTLTLEDGTHYDLSSLSSSSSDYPAQAPSGEVYKLNVCRSVVGELYNIDNPDIVGGYISREEGDFSLGKVNTNLTISPTNEPMLIMEDGSGCENSYESASTAIRFICSPSDFHAGSPVLVAALPSEDPCHFFFEWRSHVACATNPKAQLESGHYIAFGAILAIALMTWFGGHTIYNRYYLQRRGLSQFPIPSLTFPSLKLPSLSLRSASGEQSNPKWGSWRRSQQSRGYSNVRADDNDEEEGFASRFSLEDDDEDAEDLTGERLNSHAALNGETNAWRGGNSANGGVANGGDQGKVGLHQGLVDI